MFKHTSAKLKPVYGNGGPDPSDKEVADSDFLYAG